jgi:hypothetical protein
MDTIDILKQARSVITDRKAWTHGTLIDVNEDGDDCYCALGAICKVEFPDLLLLAYQNPDAQCDVYFDLNKSAAVAAVVEALPPNYRELSISHSLSHGVYAFNDDCALDVDKAHANVLAVFDAAIANERAKASPILHVQV